MAGIRQRAGCRAGFHKISSHIKQYRFGIACGGKDSGGGSFAAGVSAIFLEIQIAEQYIVRMTSEKGEGLFQSGSTVHLETVRSQTLGEERAEAFLVVQNEDRPALQDIRSGKVDLGRKSRCV